MKNLFKITIGSFFIALLLHACTEDYFEFDKIKTPEWNPNIAVPLVNSSLTLEDIVVKGDTAGKLSSNSDDILEVIYETSVLSTKGYRAYTIPTQNFADTFETQIPSNIGGSFPFTFPIDLEFKDTSGFGIVIDSLLMKKGKLSFTIENEYKHRIIVRAIFRTFTKPNGDTLELVYSIPAATASRPVQSRSDSVDLTGYLINMTEDANGNPAVNRLPIDLQTVIEIQQGVGSSPGEQLRVRGSISNADFKEFHGFLGNTTLPIEKDTLLVTLFNNFTNSDFFISNPFLDVTVFNSFAVPMEFDFLYLDAINSKKTPSTLSFDIPPTLQPLVLKYPQKYGRAITNIQLDRNNSNLDSVLSHLVKRIAFDSEATFNPDPNFTPPPGQSRNFITDTSDIGIDLKFRVPFEGRAVGFYVQDTVDFDFEFADDLDTGTVRVFAENGFPMEVVFQVTFLDSNLVPIDSLFTQKDLFTNNDNSIVAPSVVNARGETISESIKLTDIGISGERLNRLVDGRKVALRAKLITKDAALDKNVKFKTDYRLGLSIGLNANVKIDL